MNYLNCEYNFFLTNYVTNLKALAHTREWFGFIALSRSSLAFFFNSSGPITGIWRIISFTCLTAKYKPTVCLSYVEM